MTFGIFDAVTWERSFGFQRFLGHPASISSDCTMYGDWAEASRGVLLRLVSFVSLDPI